MVWVLPNLFVRLPAVERGITACSNNMGPGIEYSLKKH